MDTGELLRKIRRMEIRTRRLVDAGLSGAYRSVFKGHGVEFSEVRPYTPGDDVRLIDWNVSSRYSALYVKKLIEERELNVIFVLDASASTRFGTQNSLKCDLAAEIFGLLAFSAVENGDRVGLILFADTIEHYIAPKCSRNQVLRSIRDILNHPFNGKGTNLAAALEFVDRVIKKRSIVFLISDFLVHQDFGKSLARVNNKHEVIAILIRDRRESEIPKMGYVNLEDAETGKTYLINTSSDQFQNLFGKLTQQRDQKLADLFRKASVDVLSIRTDLPYEGPLRAFFAKLGRAH